MNMENPLNANNDSESVKEEQTAYGRIIDKRQRGLVEKAEQEEAEAKKPYKIIDRRRYKIDGDLEEPAQTNDKSYLNGSTEAYSYLPKKKEKAYSYIPDLPEEGNQINQNPNTISNQPDANLQPPTPDQVSSTPDSTPDKDQSKSTPDKDIVPHQFKPTPDKDIVPPQRNTSAYGLVHGVAQKIDQPKVNPKIDQPKKISRFKKWTKWTMGILTTVGLAGLITAFSQKDKNVNDDYNELPNSDSNQVEKNNTNYYSGMTNEIAKTSAQLKNLDFRTDEARQVRDSLEKPETTTDQGKDQKEGNLKTTPNQTDNLANSVDSGNESEGFGVQYELPEDRPLDLNVFSGGTKNFEKNQMRDLGDIATLNRNFKNFIDELSNLEKKEEGTQFSKKYISDIIGQTIGTFSTNAKNFIGIYDGTNVTSQDLWNMADQGEILMQQVDELARKYGLIKEIGGAPEHQIQITPGGERISVEPQLGEGKKKLYIDSTIKPAIETSRSWIEQLRFHATGENNHQKYINDIRKNLGLTENPLTSPVPQYASQNPESDKTAGISESNPKPEETKEVKQTKRRQGPNLSSNKIRRGYGARMYKAGDMY